MPANEVKSRRGNGYLSLLLKDRVAASLVLLFLLGGSLVLWQQGRSQTQMIDLMARQHAVAYSEALATFRTVYTAHVVNAALKKGLEVTHDYEQKEGAIPLPATLTKVLAKEIGVQGSGIKANLYSRYPFPWRGQVGQFPDDFAEAAWNGLTQSPDSPFVRVETLAGKQFLRYAVADRMRAACVNCHNSHADSPKTDWKVGDVRGVLEVDLPMDGVSQHQQAGFRQLALTLGVLGALGLVGVTLAMGRTRRDTEVGILQRSTKELTNLVDGIARHTLPLTNSSAQLTSVSQEMSACAEETSTQANLVAATAAMISKNVHTVATASTQMEAGTREVARQAAEAARVATEGVRLAQDTNATVAQLGESSKNIGNVVKVITSIAEQTNLLALNATIEAARAGDAGKGFAVVANEVKELAKQTAKATDEIGQRIAAIQGDIAAAVATIAEVGTIINRINGFQNGIASAVEEQTASTRDIGRNLAEVAKGTTDIARSITGVADATRNTSAGAQKTQKAALELVTMAAELKELVGRHRPAQHVG